MNKKRLDDAIFIVDAYAETYGRHSTTYKSVDTFIDAVLKLSAACEALSKEAIANIEHFHDLANAYEELGNWTEEVRQEYDTLWREDYINNHISNYMVYIQNYLTDTLEGIVEKITES